MLFNSPIELFILRVLSMSCHSQCSHPRAVDQSVSRGFGRTHKFPACLVAVAKVCFQKTTIGFWKEKCYLFWSIIFIYRKFLKNRRESDRL